MTLGISGLVLQRHEYRPVPPPGMLPGYRPSGDDGEIVVSELLHLRAGHHLRSQTRSDELHEVSPGVDAHVRYSPAIAPLREVREVRDRALHRERQRGLAVPPGTRRTVPRPTATGDDSGNPVERSGHDQGLHRPGLSPVRLTRSPRRCRGHALLDLLLFSFADSAPTSFTSAVRAARSRSQYGLWFAPC